MYNYNLILNVIITPNFCTYAFHRIKNHNLRLNLLPSGLLPQCHPYGFVLLHGAFLSLTPLFQLNSQETIFFKKIVTTAVGFLGAPFQEQSCHCPKLPYLSIFFITLALGKNHSSEWNHIPSLARPSPKQLKIVGYNYKISRLFNH